MTDVQKMIPSAARAITAASVRPSHGAPRYPSSSSRCRGRACWQDQTTLGRSALACARFMAGIGCSMINSVPSAPSVNSMLFSSPRSIFAALLIVGLLPQNARAWGDQGHRIIALIGRLKTDVIDLYYIHRVDPTVPIEDTIGA